MSQSSVASRPRLALLSVSDKTGLAEFARRLARAGFELVSTGGTERTLREAGLPVRDVAELTGFPEMLDGRVKTLHPRVHGGLLARRDQAEHMRQLAEQEIAPIDLVVVNLYPFAATAARAGVSLAELIENIDIGGPSMIRSAAKNFSAVTVVTAPEDYERVAAEIERHGETSAATRWELAQKAFARTADYDATIAATLARVEGGDGSRTLPATAGGMPMALSIHAAKTHDLRYGENPHQRAALYRDPAARGGIAWAECLQGKELSFNNLVDLEAAWLLAQEFEEPAAAIIKHTNPAGCATGVGLAEAYEKALACDPVSAFGGVIGVNRALDGEAAGKMAALFVECIAAPEFTAEARSVLAAKKNLRLVRVAPLGGAPELALRSISGGWLAQDPDTHRLRAEDLKVVTRRAPSEEERQALMFAWKVVKHVKSNAIVFVKPGQTVAVGAGQMSRVDSVKIAAMKAQLPLAGSAVGSDAFFPFPDGVEEAARHGATAVIQPGGSVRDAEVIAACDRLGLAMVFTGIRHFRH